MMVHFASIVCSLQQIMIPELLILVFLVNQPLTHWQKATSKLNDHFGNTKYHALSLEIASNFIDTISGHTSPISYQLESTRAQEVKENKKKLCSIVDCIITCAKQGILFRGHRDDRRDVIRMLILIIATS